MGIEVPFEEEIKRLRALPMLLRLFSFDPRPCTMCDLDENDEHHRYCMYYYSSGSAERNDKREGKTWE